MCSTSCVRSWVGSRRGESADQGRQFGHRVLAVDSADALLARLRDDLASVHLVLVDIRLSHGSGPSLVAEIRKLDDGRLPVLVFSGTVGSAADVRELAALGVAGYINEYSAVPHIVPSIAPHLFPDSFNRRSSPRVAIGIPVQYRYAQTIAASLTLNVSHGGLAVRTTTPLDTGTRVRVRFRLPGSQADIDAEGRVAWSDPRAGMGIQFDLVDNAAQTEIDNFVDAHFFSSRHQ